MRLDGPLPPSGRGAMPQQKGVPHVQPVSPTRAACSGHVFANKGVSAATSFLYAPCMSYHVPEGADLVVLEVRRAAHIVVGGL